MAADDQRANELFRAASQKSDIERAAFLARECAGDEQLLAEVTSLLHSMSAAPQSPPSTKAQLVDPHATRVSPCNHRNHPGFDVPERLGPLELSHELGRGAMGVVWLAHDSMLERKVAVKFLFGAVALPDDPGFETFIRGARAAARVEHPGLTRIFQADQFEGVPYLVMEFIDGPTLADVLARTGRVAPDASVHVLAHVCDAVGELHRHEVVHRDIKPANVLLEASGRVAVTDFGLACERSYRAPGTDVRRVAGTPQYMAPELFEGMASTRSDVYALGVMAFEMLTGRVPHDGSLDDIRRAHAESRLPTETLEASGVESTVIEVLARATHKQALYRQKTADRFAEALVDACGISLAASSRTITRLVVETHETGIDSDASSEPPESSGSSYYQTLNELAESKRIDHAVAADADDSNEPATAMPRPKHDLVDIDVECLKCSYNLRGVAIATRCPECGAPVADTVTNPKSQHLIFRSTRWLQRLRRGFTRIAASMFATIAVSVCVGLTIAFSILDAPTATIISTAIMAALIIIALIGVFDVTSTEPDGTSLVCSRRTAFIARAAAILVAVLAMCGALELLGGGPVANYLTEELSLAAWNAVMACIAYITMSIAPRVARREIRRSAIVLAAINTVLALVALSALPSVFPIVSNIALFVAALAFLFMTLLMLRMANIFWRMPIDQGGSLPRRTKAWLRSRLALHR